MKRFLKRLLYFLLAAIVVYPVLAVMTGFWLPKQYHPNLKYIRGAYGHMYSRVSEAKATQGPIDVLFLGSSHAYRGFDTRNFPAIRSFNFGSSSQTPLQTKVLLNRYLSKLKPKKVVYEVFPFSFTQDGVESSLDIIANDRNDGNTVRMALAENNIKIYNSLFFGFANDWLGKNADFKEPASKKEDTYIQGGFVERTIEYYKPEQLKETKWSPKDFQMKAFEENLRFLKEQNIEVMLVFAPVTKTRYDRFTNIAYFDSVMSSYGAYYNFNKLVSLNDSLHFYDSHHLNQTGVNIFNEALYPYLK